MGSLPSLPLSGDMRDGVARLFPGRTGLCMTALRGRALLLIMIPWQERPHDNHSSERRSDNVYGRQCHYPLDKGMVCNNVAGPRVEQAEAEASAPPPSTIVGNIECGYIINVGNSDFDTHHVRT